VLIRLRELGLRDPERGASHDDDAREPFERREPLVLLAIRAGAELAADIVRDGGAGERRDHGSRQRTLIATQRRRASLYPKGARSARAKPLTGSAAGSTPFGPSSPAEIHPDVGHEVGCGRGEVGLEPDVARRERVGRAPERGRLRTWRTVVEPLVEVVDVRAPVRSARV
jgi:hypothetical protein